MKEFKGTPAPWGLVANDGVSYGIVVASTSLGLNICDVNFSLRGDIFARNAKHDANLIAAAPDLLEALIAVVRVADRATDEFDMARAAIDKALGETK